MAGKPGGFKARLLRGAATPVSERRRGRRRAVAAILAVSLALAGCNPQPGDTRALDTCRLVLPALHPQGTLVREIAHTSLEGGTDIRIAYGAREPGEAERDHFAVCRFAEQPKPDGSLELTRLATDQGVMGEARLFYLKRFWLGAPDVALAVAEATAPPGVPELPRPAAYALQQLINALALSAVYALLAVAYSLGYGLIGRINLAFGEVGVIGAYGAIAGTATALALGLGNPLAGLVVAGLVAAGLGMLWSLVTGRLVIGPLHARFREGQPILVATAGLAVAIQEFLRLSQGPRERWVVPVLHDPIPLARAGRFIVTVTPMQIGIAATALAAACAMLWLLARTPFGRAWRAFADDPPTAALFGVSSRRMIAATFALAGLNAGLAGFIIAVYYGNVSFAMGTILALKALVAAVVGGIGSVPGAFLGGVLIGLAEGAWSAYFSIELRDVFIFSLLIVVFVLRPGGLLGFSGPRPREV